MPRSRSRCASVFTSALDALCIEYRCKQIERILAGWVAELAVPIYRGREVTSFVQDELGVEVVLSDGSVLRSDYLVGCDGGRSLIRKTAGIDFPGSAASVSYLIAELETSEEPAWGIRRGERGVNGIGKLVDGKRVRVVLVEQTVRQGEEPTPRARTRVQLRQIRHQIVDRWHGTHRRAQGRRRADTRGDLSRHGLTRARSCTATTRRPQLSA